MFVSFKNVLRDNRGCVHGSLLYGDLGAVVFQDVLQQLRPHPCGLARRRASKALRKTIPQPLFLLPRCFPAVCGLRFRQNAVLVHRRIGDRLHIGVVHKLRRNGRRTFLADIARALHLRARKLPI